MKQLTLFDENGYWNAPAYFFSLMESNRLARDLGFLTCRVSGLQGFEEALQKMQSTLNFFCVDDSSTGAMSLDNTPSVKRVRTVFMCMRHALGDMEARDSCFATMRELFRQLMSAFTKERTRLAEGFLYVDPKINFTEIEEYFFAGGACAYFQIGYDQFTSLAYNPEEWL